MKKNVLNNGLTILTEKRTGNSVAIQVSVNVGSNNEARLRGISHFIEHMSFEGTKKRPNAEAISNEIESIGGEINASTSSDRTVFFVSVLKKDFDIGLDVLSDIIMNPLYRESDIKKEKKIILEEMKLLNDDSRFYQWILFEKTLFKKHPMKFPISGDGRSVRSIKRKDLMGYYKKHYVPNNMVVSVVGNFDKNCTAKIKKKFGGLKKRKLPSMKKFLEPKQEKSEKKVEKRKTNQTYVVLGYKTATRDKKDSFVLDVIYGILGRGQSGKLFDEVRNKRGLAYEVGVNHETSKDWGYFSVYLNTHRKNVKKTVKIIMDVFQGLKKISKSDLKKGKDFVVGRFMLENDINIKRADSMAFWEFAKDARLADKYVKKIKEVNKKDIIKTVNKYLTKNYVLAVIEGK